MEKRRQFLKVSLGLVTSLGVSLSPLFSGLRAAYAGAGRIILEKGTALHSLIGKSPENLDTRALDVTPLADFRTMGTTDHQVNRDQWRLEVTGRVRKPFDLAYEQLLSMPSVERNVLLICPGVFAIHGRWKGISMKALLDAAKAENGVTHVTFSGSRGDNERSERYPIAEVLSNKVFLAYAANGEPLPQKHGFPLRVVAEDYYGSDWVKYVYRVSVDKE